MTGITAFGAYIPLFRLSSETEGWKARGEKAVASFDEDSVTMSTAATMNCLHGFDRNLLDGLYFATTTAPYLEKQGAALIAEACDLPRSMVSSDFSNSLRSGTLALRSALDAVKAGSARSVAVTAADLRLPQPRSAHESVLGDGAASVVVGNEQVIAEIEDICTVSNEMLDTWRTSEDLFLRSADDRFVLDEGYFQVLPRAVKDLLTKNRLTPQDFSKAIISAPDARNHKKMTAKLGFDPDKQVQDPLFDKVGNTGASSALLMLVAALEEAEPGDRLLFACYGDGADAFLLKVTNQVHKVKEKRNVKDYLKSKAVLPDYLTYARWRSLIDIAPPVRRPALDPPSPSALHREREQNLRLYGVSCNNCGYHQYPPQRICTRCQSRDNFTLIRFSDKQAKLFTYSLDYLGPTQDPPLVICFIDFEGGGRMQCMMTDRTISQVQIGMPLEMSFRRLYTAGGIHNYYWKCIPVRS